MKLLQKANKAFREGQYQKALDIYTQAAQASPPLLESIAFNKKLAQKKLNESKIQAIVTNVKPISLISQSKEYDARFEKIEKNAIRGWAVHRKNIGKIFDLSVYVNGSFFLKVENSNSRGDLQRAKKSNGKGGFDFKVPFEILSPGDNEVAVYLPDDVLVAKANIVGYEPSPKTHDSVRIPTKEPISIIVPVYNALEDLKVCVERLIKYTRNEVDVILINDASPDPEVSKYLNSFDFPKQFKIFHNEKNLGFTGTVNRGIDLSGSNDVVLLNSDARVTPRWLEGLKRALSTDANIATVTPMSDRAGAFSAPTIGNDNNLPSGVSEIEYAVAFRRRSVGYYPTVPTGNGFCMYIRRKAINELGALDAKAFPRGYGEENDFCMRARAAGWRNIIDDRTYVFHDRNKSFGEQKTDLIAAGRKIVDERYPDYKKSTNIFSQSPLINSARFKAQQALTDVVSSVELKPRALFVISTLTGGTPQTNKDLMMALYDRLEPWLLHCDSEVMTLYKVDESGSYEVVFQHKLLEAVEPLTHISPEYDRVIKNWLTEFDFDIVHIRHLAWHSLNLAKIANEEGAKVIKSFHDFYAACPTVKLLDENMVFCEGKCTNTQGDCKIDLWKDKLALPHLKNEWIYQWRNKFQTLVVPYCEKFITTHVSVKETLLKLLDLPEHKFKVIPHGRDFENLYQLADVYQAGDVLKVLVPGNIGPAKGRELIKEIVNLDQGKSIHFHILGKSTLQNGLGITIHGEYDREDFAKHIENIKPHIGAVFSVWNETWCHTLTELWSVGLPALVTNYSTLSDRVDKANSGWVVKDHSPIEVYNFIKNVCADPSSWLDKRNSLYKYQKSLLEFNTLKMSQSYFYAYFE